MATLLVLFRTPEDPEAFERHYLKVHLPVARRLPGLVSIRVDRVVHGDSGGEGYHFVAQLEFESLEDVRKALRSPEGQAAGNDLAQFAKAGYRLISLVPVGAPQGPA